MMTCHQQGKECKEIEIHCPRQDRGRGHPLWRSFWRKLHPEQSQERISPARCSTIETEAIRGGMAPPETQWIIPATVFPDQEEAGEEDVVILGRLDYEKLLDLAREGKRLMKKYLLI